MDARIVAYQAGTNNRLGVLLDLVKWEATFIAFAPGALRLEVAKSSQAAGVIDAAGSRPDFAIEYYDTRNNAWVEPPNGRFIGLRCESDEAAIGEPTRWVCPSTAWILGRMLDMELSKRAAEGHPQAGKHVETGTVGKLVTGLISAAKSRGNFPVTCTATATGDSTHALWVASHDFAYEIGTSILEVLRHCVEAGRVSWRMDGWTLELQAPGGTWTGPSMDVRLQAGRDYLEAPTLSTSETRADRVLVLGDNGVWGWAKAADQSPWGFLEAAIADSRVETATGGATLAAREVAKSAVVAEEHTRKILLGKARWIPLQDFRPGNKVMFEAGTGWQWLECRQITLTFDGTLGAAIVLGASIPSNSDRLAAKVAAITASATLPPGGTLPSRTEPATPGPVTGLTLKTGYRVDDGQIVPVVTASWVPPVTMATLRGYIVEFDTGTGWKTNPGQTVTTATVSECGQLVAIGQTVKVRVVAVTDYRAGTPTETQAAAVYATPEMVAPSRPVLSSAAGLLYVTWDGATATGVGWPDTFSHIHIDITYPYPSGLSGRLVTAGTATFSISTGLEPIVTLYATSLDGKTATSAPVSLPVKSVLDGIPDGSLANQLAVGAVTAAKLGDGAVTAQKLAANSVTANHLTVGAVTAAKIGAGQITTDHLDAGAITATKISATAIDGKTITGATIQTAATGARTVMTSSGLAAYDATNRKVAAIGEAVNGYRLAVWHNGKQRLVSIDEFVFGGQAIDFPGGTFRRPATSGYHSVATPRFTIDTSTAKFRLSARTLMSATTLVDIWFAIEAWIFHPATGTKIGPTVTLAKTGYAATDPISIPQTVTGSFACKSDIYTLNQYAVEIRYIWYRPTGLAGATCDYTLTDSQTEWSPC